MRRSMPDDTADQARKKLAVASTSGAPVPVAVKTGEPTVQDHIDKRHTDNVLNFLLRLACQVRLDDKYEIILLIEKL